MDIQQAIDLLQKNNDINLMLNTHINRLNNIMRRMIYNTTSISLIVRGATSYLPDYTADEMIGKLAMFSSHWEELAECLKITYKDFMALGKINQEYRNLLDKVVHER